MSDDDAGGIYWRAVHLPPEEIEAKPWDSLDAETKMAWNGWARITNWERLAAVEDALHRAMETFYYSGMRDHADLIKAIWFPDPPVRTQGN